MAGQMSHDRKRERLPIWRDCQQLLVAMEQAVRQFPRYHKYTLGTELRQQSMNLSRLLVRTLNARGQARIEKLRLFLEQVDDLKISLQLARELQVFNSFAAWARISEQVVNIGKQGGCMVAQSLSWQRRDGTGAFIMRHRVSLHHCAPVGPMAAIHCRWHEQNRWGLPNGCPGLADFTGYASNFWSSSPNANNSNNAWNVNFNNGNANNNNRNNNNRVRLVRSGS